MAEIQRNGPSPGSKPSKSRGRTVALGTCKTRQRQHCRPACRHFLGRSCTSGLAGRVLPAVVFPFLRCNWREALCDPFEQHLAILDSHRVGRSVPACLVQCPRGARGTGEPIRRVLPRPSSTMLYPGSPSSQLGLRGNTDPCRRGALVAAFSGRPLHRRSSPRLTPACNRTRTDGLFSRVP